MARIWLFGPDIDTDQIVPGRYAPYMTSEAELGKYPFVELRPEFAKEVKPGDIIVAGKNFGCGSSREYASKALKVVGLGAIIAPSFARIFFRNALNLGLPLFEADLTQVVADGEEATLLLDSYQLVTSHGTYALPAPPEFVQEIWREGNLVQYYRKYKRFPGQRGESRGGSRTASTHRVCVMPGDGIGQEVIPWAVEALKATGLPWEFVEAEIGWECFQRRGTALPEETLAVLKRCDAALFGAVSSPSQKVAGYRSPIVALRQELNLYANLRPVVSMPIAASRTGIDMLIVRENTEGLYVQRERSDGETAIAERVITRAASERIGRLACELASRRRRQLTIVHKANILPETCGLFRRSVQGVAAGFPDLLVEEVLVDTMALRLVRDPEHFDVVVTTNLFGDILSDEAAMLVGGPGLAPAGNIGEQLAIFEPVHGSAPDIAGKGIANPCAALLSAGMLLDYLGHEEAGSRIRVAVRSCLEAGYLTPDLGGTYSTVQVAQAVLDRISK